MKVTIITPCYNHGHFLNEMIESIQSEIEYELIIVNDGSSDIKTIEKLRDLEAKGITVIHQPNSGLGAARNRAIAAAKGQYIIPLDADNKLARGFIEKCCTALDGGFDVAYTDCYHFGVNGTFYNKVGGYDVLRLINGNYIDACTMFRKSVWEQAGGYDTKMPFMGHEDWELWLNLSFKGAKFIYIPEALFYYRLSADSMNNTITGPNTAANIAYISEKYTAQITRHYWKLYSKYEKYRLIFEDYMKKYPLKSVAKILLKRW